VVSLPNHSCDERGNWSGCWCLRPGAPGRPPRSWCWLRWPGYWSAAILAAFIRYLAAASQGSCCSAARSGCERSSRCCAFIARYAARSGGTACSEADAPTRRRHWMNPCDEARQAPFGWELPPHLASQSEPAACSCPVIAPCRFGPYFATHQVGLVARLRKGVDDGMRTHLRAIMVRLALVTTAGFFGCAGGDPCALAQEHVAKCLPVPRSKHAAPSLPTGSCPRLAM